MNPFDLLKTADALLSSAKGGRPTGASLRRAVSSAYYALFHCLARECADLLIGGSGSDRSEAAWQQVYRALEHGPAKTKCRKQKVIRKFPVAIQIFAGTFAELQEKRHGADYDPLAQFTKSDVSFDIAAVGIAIAEFKSAPIKHRRAFCAYILFKDRND